MTDLPTTNTPKDRSEYMRAYYDANKTRLKAKRKPQPRTAATIAAEARCAEKRRILREIQQMPMGPQTPNTP